MSIATDVPFDAIQNAIYTALQGTITGEVYDEVADDAEFPYTVIGEPMDLPFEARGVKGRSVIWPIIVHSRPGDTGGKWQLYDIMEEIVTTLTASQLSLTGWREIWKTFNQARVERQKKETGNVAYKGTVTMLITVAKL